jgi:sialic acid synthase SpsE/CMP-N-acetylneuraminic acid synthetase
VIEYTFDHALAARRVDAVLLTTDSEPAKELARGRGIMVVDRPAELASDTATVDDAARHAVRVYEERTGQNVDAVALLYGNIPVRADGLIDRAVQHLAETGADSVRSVAPVSKQHPDWIHRLDGDRMTQFRSNSIYRRQDLEPLYYHDGALAVVKRAALLAAPRWEGDHQGFLGDDRRAIVQQPEDSVDIDGPVDLHLAEAILRARGKHDAQAEDGAAAPDIAIGSAVIGAGQPVFVIAEAGVNHNGSADVALRLVDAAADAGADAVKFQMFTADTLVTADASTAEYQQAASGQLNQHAMLRELELTLNDFARVRQRCAERGVEFLATPFSAADLIALVTMGVPAVKLASTDLNNVALLRPATRAALPLIVSTGAATGAEIASAVDVLRDTGAADRTVLLHCVSSYPTEWDQANLRAIGELRQRFGLHTGFSDHTLSEATGALAAAAGARVIEKHFTLDCSATGPDHAMSLEPGGLARYIDGIRHAEAALGEGSLDVAACEQEVRQIARKSVVAARDIAAGEVLTAEALTAKRPSGGLEPGDIDRLVGRQAIDDIPADTRLAWEMVS